MVEHYHRIKDELLSDMLTEDSEYAPLLDEVLIYRAVLYKDWIKGDHVKPRAFMRRPPDKEGKERDRKGLSVTLDAGRDENAVYKAISSSLTCDAICKISVEQVRSSPTSPCLDVVQDAHDHANIVGLPDVPPADIHTDEGKAARREAERIGGELGRRACVVWKKPP